MKSNTMPAEPLLDYINGLSQMAVVDLSHPFEQGMPVSPMHIPYVFSLSRRHGDIVRDDGMSTADEVVVISGHAGTHIDAIGHASHHGRLHGSMDASEVQSGGKGLRSLGVEHVSPIVCRGILLDVAALHGVDALPPAYEITPRDLEEAGARSEVQVNPGDAVLIRTGWGSCWPDAAKFLGQHGGLPGPGEDAISWLLQRHPRVTGSDTLVYEVVHPERDVRPGHRLLLVEAAIPIIECMNLERLSEARASTFLFVASPLRLVGATGSPVRPLAVYPRTPPPTFLANDGGGA